MKLFTAKHSFSSHKSQLIGHGSNLKNMLSGIERPKSGRLASGNVGFVSSYLNTSNLTQTTVNLVSDKVVKESP
jgi:hypothetical protein